MKAKVLVDTNVLVASSVRALISEFKVDVKHLFFDISMTLISLIREHVDKRIGVVTARIETEAHNVLERAVLDELKKAGGDYTSLSAVLNICSDRLRRHLQDMTREPVEQDRVDQWFMKTSAFFALQKQRMELMDLKTIRSVAREKARFSVSKRFREIGEQIRMGEEVGSYYQLTRLRYRPVKTNDMWILAEAAYLKQYYEKEAYVKFYLASNDQHLSPVLDDEGQAISTKITDEIEKEFGIRCDWPDRVSAEFEKSLAED